MFEGLLQPVRPIDNPHDPYDSLRGRVIVPGRGPRGMAGYVRQKSNRTDKQQGFCRKRLKAMPVEFTGPVNSTGRLDLVSYLMKHIVLPLSFPGHSSRGRRCLTRGFLAGDQKRYCMSAKESFSVSSPVSGGLS